MFETAAELAESEGIAERGYRVVTCAHPVRPLDPPCFGGVADTVLTGGVDAAVTPGFRARRARKLVCPVMSLFRHAGLAGRQRPNVSVVSTNGLAPLQG